MHSIRIILPRQEFARYGPKPRYGTPSAGLCISSFAIVRKGRSLLVGVPRKHPRWVSEWAPNLAVYDPDELKHEYKSWRLPGTYLKAGEHPDKSIQRVLRQQLDLRRYKITSSKVYSFHDPSSWYPGRRHWDICFVYDVRTRQIPTRRPWFQSLEFRPIRSIRGRDFGSAHGDLARKLRLAK